MKPTHLRIFLIGLLLAACGSRPGSAQTGEPIFSITQQNQDDQITMQVEETGVVIDINSPSGIGLATFKLESGTMPQKVIVRFHLAGLEQVRIASGTTAITASVSSSDPLHGQDQRLIDAGGETPITPLNTMWMSIQIISNEAKIPLQQGFFKVEIPEKLISSNDSFEVSWIDFYR